MRKAFNWYFNPSKIEIDEAWKNGILTLDTNVLLDLYRYHEGTRNSLIQSLKKFEGKKWLSHQAATEFFRNRTKVIVSSEKAFKQAQDETEKLSSSLGSVVNNLKGNRIIPADVASNLDNAIKPLIAQAQDKITQAKANYPNFIREDPILQQLSDLFKDSVGNDFKDEEMKGIKEQAEERKKNRVPPGYLDEGKDEDRPYGDYYLWLQIIQQAKAEKCPIVLVTSERKEDWWEKISGKTTGPRPELMREAMQISGQRILIYQTEHFLEYALQRFKQPVNEVAIEEIRAVSTWRTEREVIAKIKDQSVLEGTDYKNLGTLSAELMRPVQHFTVSGHFDPNMQNVPQLNVRLQSSPELLPKHMIGAGTGTTHDFNIHISCREPGVLLPVGSYVFGYEAICTVPSTATEIRQAE